MRECVKNMYFILIVMCPTIFVTLTMLDILYLKNSDIQVKLNLFIL